MNHTVANNEIIYRGRKLIMDKIKEENRAKVKEVMNYLIEDTEDKDFLAFNPHEKWLLYYWTGQYDQILDNVRHFEAFLLQADGRRMPNLDGLARELLAKLRYVRLEVQMDIKASDLSEMEKSFLMVNLDHLIEEPTYEAQESTNQACNGFMSLYPNSEFESYIRKYLRFQFKESPLGLAYEFSSGYILLNGGLSTKFTNMVPLGLGGEATYKRFVLYLRFYIGFGLTRDSISSSAGTWKGDSQMRGVLPEASLGYQVFVSNTVEVAPFFGISSISIKPTENDQKKFPEYKNLGLDNTPMYVAGINVDVRMPDGASRFEDKYYLRLRYTYADPAFEKKSSWYHGEVHNLSIGMRIFTRRMKREY